MENQMASNLWPPVVFLNEVGSLEKCGWEVCLSSVAAQPTNHATFTERIT
jgi:hypothetical protein